MRQRHKFLMQFPGRLGFCSTTVAIKVLFLLVSLLLLVLFLQNMFYAVYAKFNLHQIRLVHQQSSWNEKPAKMVELLQMTSNFDESQRLRRIANYIFVLLNYGYIIVRWVNEFLNRGYKIDNEQILLLACFPTFKFQRSFFF